MSSLLQRLRDMPNRRTWLTPAVAVAVLGAVVWLQLNIRKASQRTLLAIAATAGTVVLLQYPILGPYGVIFAALCIATSFGTGTAVALNLATLLVPVALALWAASELAHGRFRLTPSRVTRPLLLFLTASLLSLWVGMVLWDPAVPRPQNILFVQLGQWGMFAVAGGAVLLVANVVRSEAALRHLVYAFLALAGIIVVGRYVPGFGELIFRYVTFAYHRAPFWMLITALALGQLLYNRGLSGWGRLGLVAILAAVLGYSLFDKQESASTWVAVAVAVVVLIWFRYRRLRWFFLIPVLVALVTGVLTNALWEFAGGDDEWLMSGGSRLALIERVVEVTMRNPITGLGPAAYRHYAVMRPLPYRGAFYITPAVNSHNNYVDLFAHAGALGLGLFLWLMAEFGALAVRLRPAARSGFLSGYVHAMLAAWVGALVLMAFADWILPHVYNIGFPGFQASLLFWLFMGGLVAVERIVNREAD
jgi:hypothetical protein